MSECKLLLIVELDMVKDQLNPLQSNLSVLLARQMGAQLGKQYKKGVFEVKVLEKEVTSLLLQGLWPLVVLLPLPAAPLLPLHLLTVFHQAKEIFVIQLCAALMKMLMTLRRCK